MKKIKLYIAISLDGKIAKPNGDVKWLEEIPNPQKLDYDYVAFNESIDTTLMGNKTYQQILSFGVEFPYQKTQNFVFTKNKNLKDTEHVIFQSENLIPFVETLKKKKGKDIWLIGGAQINSLLFKAQLIDEIWLYIMPIVIGEGIPLFDNMPIEKQMTLLTSKQFPTGVVFLKYGLKN